ncbi:MAG: hypothetical protein V4622_04280 [Bacteroidota bacterium]
MLGLIPLYFIGRYFFQLAHEHDRSPWGFALLGVGISIVTQILIGFFIGLFIVFTNNHQLMDNLFLTTILPLTLPLGIVFLVYKLLEKNWIKNPIQSRNDDLLDR